MAVYETAESQHHQNTTSTTRPDLGDWDYIRGVDMLEPGAQGTTTRISGLRWTLVGQ